MKRPLHTKATVTSRQAIEMVLLPEGDKSRYKAMYRHLTEAAAIWYEKKPGWQHSGLPCTRNGGTGRWLFDLEEVQRWAIRRGFAVRKA